MRDESAAASGDEPTPVPPPPASPGTGSIGRAWLIAGGVGCGCIGTLSLCAVIALFTVVIGPAVRDRPAEAGPVPPTVTAAASGTVSPEPPRALAPTPTTTAPKTAQATATVSPAEQPTAQPESLPPPPPATASETARPAPGPAQRDRTSRLPEATEAIEVGNARIGVMGLTTLDADGRPVTERLGATSFSPEQRGLAAVFTYDRAAPEGSLSFAGIWVASQGERVTPLADPVFLEANPFDEGRPLIFHITFRSGAMPTGAYAFGLFTLENGQVDRLLKRLDFKVE